MRAEPLPLVLSVHPFLCTCLSKHLHTLELTRPVFVSPDAGGVERARAYAKKLNASLAIIDKRRAGPNVAEVMNLVGDVEGCDAIIIDDLIDTGGTLVQAAETLQAFGARRVLTLATHPVLSGPAISRLIESCIEQVIVSDTIPLTSSGRACPKIRIISVSELFGEAIKRVHAQDSVSSLFE